MGLWERIKTIFRANSVQTEEPKVERTVMMAEPGDVIEASLETYTVVGVTHNSHRSASLIAIQSGSTVRYLYAEEREKVHFVLYEPLDGYLNNLEEVPGTLDVDGVTYRLEDHFQGYVSVKGKTAFANGEQLVWVYKSDAKRMFRIEWQDGHFVFYEGEELVPADVKMIHGK